MSIMRGISARENNGGRPKKTLDYRFNACVLDLEDQAVTKKLKLKVRDLRATWRTAPGPTKTRWLGTAISQQQRFAAIR
jgi:hypothetical protein